MIRTEGSQHQSSLGLNSCPLGEGLVQNEGTEENNSISYLNFSLQIEGFQHALKIKLRNSFLFLQLFIFSLDIIMRFTIVRWLFPPPFWLDLKNAESCGSAKAANLSIFSPESRLLRCPSCFASMWSLYPKQ